jgi:hypothetical protein
MIIEQDRIAYPTVDLVLIGFVLLLDHKQGVIEQEDQQVAAVALRTPAALQGAFVNHLTALFFQSQILIAHTN